MLAAQLGSCPAEPRLFFEPVGGNLPSSTALDPPDQGGRICIVAWSKDMFDQVSPPTATWIDVPPLQR